jgi:hypothetical protein
MMKRLAIIVLLSLATVFFTLWSTLQLQSLTEIEHVEQRTKVLVSRKSLVYYVDSGRAILSKEIEMKYLRKQRLKPLPGLLVLGGPLCPLKGQDVNATHLGTKQGSGKFIRWSRRLLQPLGRETLPGARDHDIICPNYARCPDQLSDVSYCNVHGIDDLETRTYDAPRDLNDRIISNLVYEKQSPPYQGQVVRLHGSSYFVNMFGHVFTENVQYMHGGCQDFVDQWHGGDRSYYPETAQVLYTFTEALNLVHLYGDNYYHFLIEVLPRFYLVKNIIESKPKIPILLRHSNHIHALKLLGLDPKELNIHFLNQENQLAYIIQTVYFPLSTRCLHASYSLMDSVRNDIIMNMKLRYPILKDITLTNRMTSMKDNDVKLVKIVYFSRATTPDRRHLLEEEELLHLLCDQLQMQNVLSRPLSHNMDFNKAFDFNFDKVRSYVSDENNHGIRFGLTVLYGNESLETVIASVSSASILMGPHGAALSNAIFLPHSAFVLEFIPEGYYNPCFIHLCSALHLRHYGFKTNGTHTSPLSIDGSQHKISNWILEKARFTANRIQ